MTFMGRNVNEMNYEKTFLLNISFLICMFVEFLLTLYYKESPYGRRYNNVVEVSIYFS